MAILGAGFMGTMHAAALRQLQMIADEDAALPDWLPVADSDPQASEEFAARFEIPMWTTDWQSLIDDPRVDVVTIATPNNVHVDMATAAARCGKHVYCEKPLGTDLADARRALDAVTDAGVTTLVAFSYLFNPVQTHVRSLLESGELGDVISFRGTFDQDLFVDPSEPFNWRMDRAVAGPGALADLGAHVIALALHLVGPLDVVSSMMRTLVPSCQVSIGGPVSRAVENEDEAYLLGRFAGGATCVVGASRVATGRKVGLSYEIQCTRGSVTFAHERINEFGLYRHGEPAGRGYSRILAGRSWPVRQALPDPWSRIRVRRPEGSRSGGTLRRPRQRCAAVCRLPLRHRGHRGGRGGGTIRRPSDLGADRGRHRRGGRGVRLA